MSCKQFLRYILEEQSSEGDHIRYDDDEECNFSNFMDRDWLSSSGNSCEEEGNER